MPPKIAKAAPAATEGGEERKAPTANEAFLFYSIIKHMKGKPEIDWASVASDAGLKNADTAKVRYGQIKRKLGLDTWTPTKSKNAAATATAAADDNGDTPGTPTPKSTRSRKTAATPSTPGMGAGVKKRGGAKVAGTPSTGRGRKAKTNLLTNPVAEEDEANEFDDADLDESMLLSLASPTPAKPRGRPTTAKPATAAAANLGPINHNNSAAVSASLMADYAAFPVTLPEMVLARKAVLVCIAGTWTLAPASQEMHARWLARLPANVQTRFYTQVHGVGSEEDDIPGVAAGGGTIGLGYLTAPAHGAAAAAGQAATGTHVTVAPASNAGEKNANKPQVHSAFVAEMEVRDREALFGAAVEEEEEEVGAV